MVSTHLKNISQNGSLPQVRVKITNVSNHHLENQHKSRLFLEIPSTSGASKLKSRLTCLSMEISLEADRASPVFHASGSYSGNVIRFGLNLRQYRWGKGKIQRYTRWQNIWPNYNVSPTWISMNLRGFPFSATFWGEVVWGRYNLTQKCDYQIWWIW